MSQVIDKSETATQTTVKPGFFRRHKFLSFLLVLLVIMSGLGAQLYFSHENLKSQGWNYTIQVNPNPSDWSQHVRVDYDSSSAAGLEAFVSAMRRENEQVFLSGLFEAKAVTIYFNRPLTWDEADTFVKKYRIYATGYNTWFVDTANPSNGGIMSMGVERNGQTGEGFDDFPKKRLEQLLANINPAKNTTYLDKGIIGVQVSLDYYQYRQVVADQNVYFVEMLRQVVKNQMRQGPFLDLVAAHLFNYNPDDLNLYDFQLNGPTIAFFQQLADFKLVKW